MFRRSNHSILNRRSLLASSCYGLGAMALGSLSAAENIRDTAAISGAHFPPRVRNIIFLFMSGGPSHLDLFDPKPQLTRQHGEPVSASLTKTLADPVIRGSAKYMASPRTFKRCGQSGIEFSDYLPYTSQLADEICLIRSAYSDQSNHDPAQLLLNCGTPLFGNPSFGSWVVYGLGSESRDLPGYVVLLSNSGKGVDAGSSLWSSGFMPSNYRGVTFRSSGDPILYLSNPPGVTDRIQKSRLDLIKSLDQLHHQQVADPEIESRISAYELAFRMQHSAPELLDFRDESESTQRMYGLDQEITRSFGTNCLLARRMVERGVRFIQLFHSTWDDHNYLNKNLKTNCDMTDLPTVGLIRDLKQRGLLDDTLVIWAGEFG
ncbi:MAG: hypothetical protein RLY14_2683, partial [Planctomycetota bacterium]